MNEKKLRKWESESRYDIVFDRRSNMHYLWSCELCGWGVYPERNEKPDLVLFLKDEAVKHLQKHIQMQEADSERAKQLLHILLTVLGNATMVFDRAG